MNIIIDENGNKTIVGGKILGDKVGGKVINIDGDCTIVTEGTATNDKAKDKHPKHERGGADVVMGNYVNGDQYNGKVIVIHKD